MKAVLAGYTGRKVVILTNEMIILNERLRLLKEGVLKSTGRTLEFTDDAGECHKYEEPEPIHSFSYWKNTGRIVKKGSKAIAAFPIWIMKKKKKNDNDDIDAKYDEEDEKQMYLKKTFFFTYDQTEEVRDRKTS